VPVHEDTTFFVYQENVYLKHTYLGVPFSVGQLHSGFKWFKIFYEKREAIIISVIPQAVK